MTLVYLSIQTQQNTDAINAQSRQSLFEGGQEEHPVWIENPDLTLLIIDNSIEMTLEQKVRMDGLLILSLARREFAWRQYEAGLLDENSWKSEAGIVSLLLGTERTRHWWNTIGKMNFGDGFVAEAEAIFLGEPVHPYWEGIKNL